jgi:hypothetical protein
VVAPETGKLVRVEVLSRGTQDQIFLVERLEIARLLDPSDGARLCSFSTTPSTTFTTTVSATALSSFAEVAGERQVVLFAEESDIVRRAREVCGTAT